MPKQPPKKLYIAVDLGGRRQGYVLGAFDDIEVARLYAANTAAAITIFEVKAVEVE